MNINISNALRDVNNSILLVGGDRVNNMEETLHEYQEMNPSVETCILKNTGSLIALESPEKLMKILIS